MYDATDFSKEKLALATVVNIEESSYRRVGARMLVSSLGHWTGGISGGCLEGDALRRSQKAIFTNQQTIVTYDTLDDDTNEIGVGLGCNGKIDVLFSPLDHLNQNQPIKNLKTIVQNNEPVILLHVIESIHQPLLLGYQKIISLDGKENYFEKLEAESVTTEIQKARLRRRPHIFKTKDRQGRQIKVLAEYIKPELRLIIVGDNYDVLAMVNLVLELGWEIIIVGRKKKMSKTLFEKAHAIYQYEEIDQIPTNEYTSVVLMTHDFEWDQKMVPLLLRKKFAYIGMLGPKKRWKKMQQTLDLTPNQIEKVYAPIGLDIGAESPEEIAISILSEIIAVFRQRNGQSLLLRETSIHDRY